jgi:hypothetical protein
MKKRYSVETIYSDDSSRVKLFGNFMGAAKYFSKTSGQWLPREISSFRTQTWDGRLILFNKLVDKTKKF